MLRVLKKEIHKRKPKRSSVMHSSLAGGNVIAESTSIPVPGKYDSILTLSNICLVNKHHKKINKITNFPNDLMKNRPAAGKRLKSSKNVLTTNNPNVEQSCWLTGGPVGTKDSFLVFRVSALAKYCQKNSSNSEEDLVLSNSQDHDVFDRDNLPKTAQPKFSDNNQRRLTIPTEKTTVAATAVVTTKPTPILETKSSSKSSYFYKSTDNNELEKKRSNDSLSSSDNSISSACDDPTEVEADILKASIGNDVARQSHELKRKLSVEVAEKENCSTVTATVGNNVASGSSGIGGGNSAMEIKRKMKPIIEKRPLALSPQPNCSNNIEIEPSQMPAKTLSINYRFVNTETQLLRKIFMSHGLQESDDGKPFNLLWAGNHIKPDILRNLAPYQRVNHFPRSYELTRKDRLYKNIETMQQLRGMKNFDIAPLSFMLPSESRMLMSAHRAYRGQWIVKPVASSRGRGIFIVNSPEQIPLDDQLLVSRYIADPLCIDGHKCDVRLYVAVTSFDPLLIYLYEEGLVRLATVKYEKNTENLWNPCMHLCNYSINKYHSDYIKATDSCEDVGHKWTFSALLRHLKNQGCDTKELMSNIEDIIVKSILACSQSIISACRMFVPNMSNCFELFGFDILIDDTLKPWLLEANLSPSLGIDTPLDAKVKASVLVDLLNLIGVPAINPLNRAATDSKWNRFRNSTASRKFNNDQQTKNKSTVGPGFLTAEENRIVKNANGQYARKGGFVRIFPTIDTMTKYGQYLDSTTGIPISIVTVNGSNMILPHNFNQMLFNNLFLTKWNKELSENSMIDHMAQYERILNTTNLNLISKSTISRCSEQARRLRQQMRKLIESGSEMSQLQARKIFYQYLECVLKRITQDSKCGHEKLILKFITRSNFNIKTPSFIQNQIIQNVPSKDRSAMVAKLLGDYLELYNRETEAYVDDCDRFGIIPRKIFDEFLSQAHESDLEYVLTLHTNVTQSLPFLGSRTAGTDVPPPIRTGANGFLKALPAMAPQIASRDLARIDSYYKSINNLTTAGNTGGGGAVGSRSRATGGTGSCSNVLATTGGGGGNSMVDKKQHHDKIMSTSNTLPAKKNLLSQPLKKRSVSQSAVNR